MTRTQHRIVSESLVAFAAAAFAWSAACSWQGMVLDPGRYVGPALVAALLVAASGALLRSARVRWYGVLAAQLGVLVVWFHHRLGADTFAGGWIPTPHGLARVVEVLREGSSQVNTYAAPLPVTYLQAPEYLIACAMLIILLIDLLAAGLRLPAWSGLPALVAVTIPISILDDGLPTAVYLITGILFAVVLGVCEAARASSWGPAPEPATDPATSRTGRWSKWGRSTPSFVLAGPAVLIGAAATLGALVLAVVVPLGGGILGSGSSGRDEGTSGSGGQVTLDNPLVDLRRDLVRRDGIPLLDVETPAKDVSYVRLTILDTFAGNAWVPSPRDLDSENRASGPFPDPAGLVQRSDAVTNDWFLATTEMFRTTWLPTPANVLAIDIDTGDWRFDPRFGDIASTDEPPPTMVNYVVRSLAQPIRAEVLDQAGPAPASVLQSMTTLPPLPPAVEDLARRITAGATTVRGKAALLQDWFRNTGGFRYSLDAAPGEGLDQLVRFLTTDKVGYCEQFAASMALMARTLGIPARVVVGFLSPSERVAGSYRYTSDDLHAWPEIYFAGSGWVRFEPTPSARTGPTPPWTRDEEPAAGPTAEPTRPAATPSPRPSRAPATAPEDPVRAEPGGPGSATTIALGIVGAALAVLVLAGPALLRGRQRAHRWRRSGEDRVDVELLWAELQATAVDHSISWPAGRSPRMLAADLAARSRESDDGAPSAAPRDLDDLDGLVTLVERARYADQCVLTNGEHDRARATVERWCTLLATSVPPTRQRIARVLPRSVFASRS